MQIHQALAEALKKNGLKSSAVAEMANIGQSQVSYFLSGRRGVNYQTLSALLDAIPESVYLDFCWLMAGQRPGNVSSVEDAMETLAASKLSDEQIATLLNIASSKLRESSPTKEPIHI